MASFESVLPATTTGRLNAGTGSGLHDSRQLLRNSNNHLFAATMEHLRHECHGIATFARQVVSTFGVFLSAANCTSEAENRAERDLARELPLIMTSAAVRSLWVLTFCVNRQSCRGAKKPGLFGRPGLKKCTHCNGFNGARKAQPA